MKEIPLETLRILLDNWHYANQGELSTIELLMAIEYMEYYAFTNIGERLLQSFKSILDEQNRLEEA